MKVIFKVLYDNETIKEIPYFFETDIDVDNVAKHYFHGIKKQILTEKIKEYFSNNKIEEDTLIDYIDTVYDYLSKLTLEMVDGNENQT